MSGDLGPRRQFTWCFQVAGRTVVLPYLLAPLGSNVHGLGDIGRMNSTDTGFGCGNLLEP